MIRCAIAAACLVASMGSIARAQSNEDTEGFTVRHVSLSTGYGWVQLPPITLQGYLPNDVLQADLVASAAAAIDWRHITPRTRYTLALFGSYTGRARFAELRAPGGDVTFGVSHVIGKRWRLDGGVASVIVSSEQLAFQPTQSRRLVDDATSFDDLAGAVALARSPSPDLTYAAMFMPITQPIDEADAFGTRVMLSSARAHATYQHSLKLATRIRGHYTTVRQISSNHHPGQVLLSQNSTAKGGGIGIRYDRSPRTQLLIDADWSETAGASMERVVTASAGYAWTGRKWFMLTRVGAALRPFETPVSGTPSTTTATQRPSIVYDGSVGYKFRTQTLLVQYSRATHDQFGHGGRNVVTGFEGNVQSIAGSWSWSAPRSGWIARSDVSLFRGPGNFSYIYTWLSTTGLGRQLGPNLSVVGEVLFDRHGSRGFEGFHLTREGARLTVYWTPTRRPVE